MVPNIDELYEWMAAQPLCQWVNEKQRKIDSGEILPSFSPPPPRQPSVDDRQSEIDRELAEALKMMS